MEERKNILGDLLDEAIRMAYETGAGSAEDEEYDTGLAVEACWFECKNDETKTQLHIAIFQNDIALITYDEPGTICRT